MEPPFLAPLEYRAGELRIRAYSPGDGPALQRAVFASYEHLRPWMPWDRAEQSVAEAEAVCRRAAGRYLLGEDFTLSIWLGEAYAGGTGYHLRHGGIATGTAEVGMWISAALAGRGLGTRVLRAMLQWGFTEWPWERLVWRCDVRNLASARVAEKAGLVREATLRGEDLDVTGARHDMYLYAILRRDWQAAP